MATYWTLAAGSTEKQLKDWGFKDDLSLQRVNQAPDICTVSAVAATDAAFAFAFGDAIIIRRDRVSSDGSTNSFSSGSIWFRGKAQLPTRIGDGPNERIQYRFAGPWWDFERLVFQQEWKTAPSPPTLVSATISELFLGQKIDGTLQNTGEQITEAINWAITCGVSVQVGTIDPATNIVTYNVRDITVAEVLIQMLRWNPDVITWFDYSTSPPTLNARSLANLTNVTVTVGTEKFRSLRLQPRYDLQLPAVYIQFKSINESDGTSWLTVTNQKYPGGATGQELGALVATIELAGSRATSVSASIVCTAIDAQSGTGATRVAWWKIKEQLFRSAKIANLSITSATVTDRDGTTASLSTYPNELIQGQIAPWMGFSQKQITVKAVATYDLYEDDSHTFLRQKNRTKEISVNITATDGTTGDYSTPSSFTPAEGVPTGLAQSIYDSRSTLQYDGTIMLVDTEVLSGVAMGKKLTIAGTSLTLNSLLIQSITEEPFYGRMTIQIGPSKHLGIADLIELLRVNRYRLIYNNPATRVTAQNGVGAGVPLGDDTVKENTTSGLGIGESFTATADGGSSKKLVAQHDAKGDTAPGATSGYPIFILYRQASDGTLDTTFARIIANLHDLTGTNKEAKFREFHWLDKDDCTEKKAWVLMTDAEDA